MAVPTFLSGKVQVIEFGVNDSPFFKLLNWAVPVTTALVPSYVLLLGDKLVMVSVAVPTELDTVATFTVSAPVLVSWILPVYEPTAEEAANLT